MAVRDTSAEHAPASQASRHGRAASEDRAGQASRAMRSMHNSRSTASLPVDRRSTTPIIVPRRLAVYKIDSVYGLRLSTAVYRVDRRHNTPQHTHDRVLAHLLIRPRGSTYGRCQQQLWGYPPPAVRHRHRPPCRNTCGLGPTVSTSERDRSKATSVARGPFSTSLAAPATIFGSAAMS